MRRGQGRGTRREMGRGQGGGRGGRQGGGSGGGGGGGGGRNGAGGGRAEVVCVDDVHECNQNGDYAGMTGLMTCLTAQYISGSLTDECQTSMDATGLGYMGECSNKVDAFCGPNAPSNTDSGEIDVNEMGACIQVQPAVTNTKTCNGGEGGGGGGFESCDA